jgi:hypothetical protein
MQTRIDPRTRFCHNPDRPSLLILNSFGLLSLAQLNSGGALLGRIEVGSRVTRLLADSSIQQSQLICVNHSKHFAETLADLRHPGISNRHFAPCLILDLLPLDSRLILFAGSADQPTQVFFAQHRAFVLRAGSATFLGNHELVKVFYLFIKQLKGLFGVIFVSQMRAH